MILDGVSTKVIVIKEEDAHDSDQEEDGSSKLQHEIYRYMYTTVHECTH